jgi:selenocysteine lyase/cysteine desulfurase
MTVFQRNGFQGISRRQFARLLAATGTAALMPSRAADATDYITTAKTPVPTPVGSDEGFWREVREHFLIPQELAPLNAANLCPSPVPVIDKLQNLAQDIDRDPSPYNRAKLSEGREATRTLLARYLRVSPEEIVITRNTSEANNLVSSGLDLGPQDEVIIFSDNHPSNNLAWREKAKRFGFTVKTLNVISPHPGTEYYIDAVSDNITTRTKVLAFTHVSNTAGDLFPAKELCSLAREHGVLTLVDGAQSFGVLDLDLGDMRPDFFTGSAHKWPCGPKETGVLYLNRHAESRIAPSIISLYAGKVGVSERLEGMGQRDNPAIVAFGDALEFQLQIGQTAIEARARELTQALIEGLQTINGIELWTHPSAERSAAVLSFTPGNLDPRKLAAALYENDGIICAARSGDRTGLRLSPHLYNLHEEVERTLAAIKRYVERGL